jgi:uncharacterized protein
MGETVLMKERILQELERVEKEKSVRVLLAVESGSRAWGFASPDSDYDVRFIYSHSVEWYLAVFEGRDVIEEMLPGDLDVSGWELRKALRLFSKCNLALNEWLGSPVIYSEAPGFRAELSALMPYFFNPVAGVHHYRSMAAQAFAAGYDGRCIGIKKLFYVLRALLACRWIEQRRSQPPTSFAELLVDGVVTRAERRFIEESLEAKASAHEADVIEITSERADAIGQELERFKIGIPGVTAVVRGVSGGLDPVLRGWVWRRD